MSGKKYKSWQEIDIWAKTMFQLAKENSNLYFSSNDKSDFPAGI